MRDQQPDSVPLKRIPEQKTQQGGRLHDDALPVRESVQTCPEESLLRGEEKASSDRRGAVSSHACSASRSSSVEAAGGSTDVAASEGQHEENCKGRDMRSTNGFAVDKGTETKIRTEHHQPSKVDMRAACLKSGASAIIYVKEEQTIAGAAAAPGGDGGGTLVGASETGCVGDALAAGALRDGEKSFLCGNCRRLFRAACDADSQSAPNACISGLCRDCSVKCSKGREDSLYENGSRQVVQTQKGSDELDEDVQTGVAGGTGVGKSGNGASDTQLAGEMGDVSESAANKTISNAENSEVHAHTEALAKPQAPGDRHEADKKKLPQGEKLHEDSKASHQRISAASSCAPTAERKNDAAIIKAERLVEVSAEERSSVDPEDKAAKGETTECGAESSTFVKHSVISVSQDVKSVELGGTCAEQHTSAKDAKASSDVNKAAPVKSTIDGSKSLTNSKSDLQNGSSTSEKEGDMGSTATADPGIGTLERSNSARESKDGVTSTQEGGGSGAEDEEEEEEEGEFQGGLSGESEKKEYMASRKRGVGETVTRGKPTSPRSLSPSPCHYRRKRRRGDNGAVATRCKVNVGPRHQVPALPPFFLDSSCASDGRADRLPETRELYNHDAGDTARLVYSPFAMQRVYRKRLAEGTIGEGGIRNADEMNDFIRKVAENWTNKSGWQPFSPEYAYKLLHFAGYDPQRALRIMKDPRFCFTTICDPPQRRYDNKWRPKDRRGQIATHPYPSPLTLRAYLSRRNQHAAATAAQESASSRV